MHQKHCRRAYGQLWPAVKAARARTSMKLFAAMASSMLSTAGMSWYLTTTARAPGARGHLGVGHDDADGHAGCR